MGIRLIATDIDGTLIDDTERIPQQLIDIVQKAQQRGIHFAVATGRTKELAAEIVKTLGVTGPYVAANGACIFEGENCIYSQGFQAYSVLDILRQADLEGLTVTFSNEYTERAVRRTDYVQNHQKMGKRFQTDISFEETDWRAERFQKIMIMDENRTGKIKMYQSLIKKYNKEYSITAYSDVAIELGPPGCNKAAGLRKLTELLGLHMGQVMACGDFLNDLEMIQEAGIGVAVANAAGELKEKADYVAQKAYCYGVIEAIEKYCFKGEVKSEREEAI